MVVADAAVDAHVVIGIRLVVGAKVDDLVDAGLQQGIPGMALLGRRERPPTESAIDWCQVRDVRGKDLVHVEAAIDNPAKTI